MNRLARVVTTLLISTLAAAGCAAEHNPDNGLLSVRSADLSSATRQDVHVFAPEGNGRWPVVVALHGIGGSARDLSTLATRLAGAGTVVFAPTYRSDLTRADGLNQATADIVCGYQLARAEAARHGGDLSRPVTAVGWSLGASFAVLGGLSSASGPSPGDPCPGGATPPDVVVGISGCYYEYQGRPSTWFEDVSTMGNSSAEVYLIAGEEDTTCPASQSERLAGSLRDAGLRVSLVRVAGADHLAPVLLEKREGRLTPASDDAAGQLTVDVILDAIAAAAA
jgi:dienelactone hydrolase